MRATGRVDGQAGMEIPVPLVPRGCSRRVGVRDLLEDEGPTYGPAEGGAGETTGANSAVTLSFWTQPQPW